VRIPSAAGTDSNGADVRGRPVALVPTCLEGVLDVPLAQTEQPQECPKCKQRSCQKLWECRDCGTQFLPKGVPTNLRCPACGSAAVGTAEATVGGLEGSDSP
jgi:predicted Zn-ribbon and HTH transcriptional regulator